MNFVATVRVKVLAKSQEKNKDGSKTYNKLTVMSGTDAGSVYVSDELFRGVECERTYDIFAQYREGAGDRGKYAMFTLISVIKEIDINGQDNAKAVDKK